MESKAVANIEGQRATRNQCLWAVNHRPLGLPELPLSLGVVAQVAHFLFTKRLSASIALLPYLMRVIRSLFYMFGNEKRPED